jgi:hypothetical protein
MAVPGYSVDTISRLLGTVRLTEKVDAKNASGLDPIP